MLNKIATRFMAAAACAVLVSSIGFVKLGFVSNAFMIEADESKEGDSDKPTNASIDSVDFKLKANGISTMPISKMGLAFNHETSFLDLVMGSADSLGEKSFYEDKIAANVEPYLNIRATDNESSEVVGKLYPASYGTIIEEGEEWTKITSGSVTGYVRNEYVSFAEEAEEIAEEFGTEAILVSSEETNIHSSEDTASEVISEASANSTYTIVMPEKEESEETDEAAKATESEDKTKLRADKVKEVYPEWLPVIYTEDQVGYVLADDVTVIMALKEAVSTEANPSEQSSEADADQTDSSKGDSAITSASTNQSNRQANTTNANAAGSTSSSASALVTSSDEYLLACLIFCEAGNQSYEGQLAVANVVLNRVRTSGFENSISGVIYEPNQFSPASNGSLAKALNNGPPSSAVKVAKDALAGSNNIGDYLYFNGYVDLSTVSSYQVIEDHTFYNVN